MMYAFSPWNPLVSYDLRIGGAWLWLGWWNPLSCTVSTGVTGRYWPYGGDVDTRGYLRQTWYSAWGLPRVTVNAGAPRLFGDRQGVTTENSLWLILQTNNLEVQVQVSPFLLSIRSSLSLSLLLFYPVHRSPRCLFIVPPFGLWLFRLRSNRLSLTVSLRSSPYSTPNYLSLLRRRDWFDSRCSPTSLAGSLDLFFSILVSPFPSRRLSFLSLSPIRCQSS